MLDRSGAISGGWLTSVRISCRCLILLLPYGSRLSPLEHSPCKELRTKLPPIRQLPFLILRSRILLTRTFLRVREILERSGGGCRSISTSLSPLLRISPQVLVTSSPLRASCASQLEVTSASPFSSCLSQETIKAHLVQYMREQTTADCDILEENKCFST